MPNNAVKTPADEKKWEEAKALAAKQNQAKNFAYIMTIYKSLKGEEKKSEQYNDLTEKIASLIYNDVTNEIIKQAYDVESGIERVALHEELGIEKEAVVGAIARLLPRALGAVSKLVGRSKATSSPFGKGFQMRKATKGVISKRAPINQAVSQSPLKGNVAAGKMNIKPTVQQAKLKGNVPAGRGFATAGDRISSSLKGNIPAGKMNIKPTVQQAKLKGNVPAGRGFAAAGDKVTQSSLKGNVPKGTMSIGGKSTTQQATTQQAATQKETLSEAVKRKAAERSKDRGKVDNRSLLGKAGDIISGKDVQKAKDQLAALENKSGLGKNVMGKKKYRKAVDEAKGNITKARLTRAGTIGAPAVGAYALGKDSGEKKSANEVGENVENSFGRYSEALEKEAIYRGLKDTVVRNLGPRAKKIYDEAIKGRSFLKDKAEGLGFKIKDTDVNLNQALIDSAKKSGKAIIDEAPNLVRSGINKIKSNTYAKQQAKLPFYKRDSFKKNAPIAGAAGAAGLGLGLGTRKKEAGVYSEMLYKQAEGLKEPNGVENVPTSDQNAESLNYAKKLDALKEKRNPGPDNSSAEDQKYVDNSNNPENATVNEHNNLVQQKKAELYSYAMESISQAKSPDNFAQKDQVYTSDSNNPENATKNMEVKINKGQSVPEFKELPRSYIKEDQKYVNDSNNPENATVNVATKSAGYYTEALEKEAGAKTEAIKAADKVKSAFKSYKDTLTGKRTGFYKKDIKSSEKALGDVKDTSRGVTNYPEWHSRKEKYWDETGKIKDRISHAKKSLEKEQGKRAKTIAATATPAALLAAGYGVKKGVQAVAKRKAVKEVASKKGLSKLRDLPMAAKIGIPAGVAAGTGAAVYNKNAGYYTEALEKEAKVKGIASSIAGKVKGVAGSYKKMFTGDQDVKNLRKLRKETKSQYKKDMSELRSSVPPKESLKRKFTKSREEKARQKAFTPEVNEKIIKNKYKAELRRNADELSEANKNRLLAGGATAAAITAAGYGAKKGVQAIAKRKAAKEWAKKGTFSKALHKYKSSPDAIKYGLPAGAGAAALGGLTYSGSKKKANLESQLLEKEAVFKNIIEKSKEYIPAATGKAMSYANKLGVSSVDDILKTVSDPKKTKKFMKNVKKTTKKLDKKFGKKISGLSENISDITKNLNIDSVKGSIKDNPKKYLAAATAATAGLGYAAKKGLQSAGKKSLEAKKQLGLLDKYKSLPKSVQYGAPAAGLGIGGGYLASRNNR